MTEREKAILWLSSFVKNKEPMTLIPKQLIRLMHEALTEQPDIVRCKDCEHCYFASNRTPDERSYACEKHGIDIVPEWFCADGKRKE